MTVYADLEGWKTNSGTIPEDLVATAHVPDIRLLDKTKKRIVLLELTCPFESSGTSFKNAEDRKTDCYEPLTLDLKERGYDALNMPKNHSPNLPYSKGRGSLEAAIPLSKIR